MSMAYSVIGRGVDNGAVPRSSLALLRNVHSLLGVALGQLPTDETQDAACDPEHAYRLDYLVSILDKVAYLVPDIRDVWLCGYAWGTDNAAWTTWSGHEDKRTAERWLEAWRNSPVAHPRDLWEVRRGDCQLGRFMPKGTRVQTVMAALR